jgi:Protein kinase domain
LDGNKEIALTGASLVSQEAARTLKFEDHYILQEQLAKGSFGTVYATEHVETGDAASFAVKVIERSRLKSEKDTDLVAREVAILHECRDIVNVVQLVDFYDSPEKLYVVQVRAMGGDVFGRLASLNSYNEKNARDLAFHLIVAMKALHERRIAHRDLKPEVSNFLALRIYCPLCMLLIFSRLLTCPPLTSHDPHDRICSCATRTMTLVSSCVILALPRRYHREMRGDSRRGVEHRPLLHPRCS